MESDSPGKATTTRDSVAPAHYRNRRPNVVAGPGSLATGNDAFATARAAVLHALTRWILRFELE